MAAAAILDFLNVKFLTVGTVKKAELHQCAKFLSKSLEPRPRYVTFNIMLVWFKNAYSRPFGGFFGAHFAQMMSLIVLTQKGPSLG